MNPKHIVTKFTPPFFDADFYRYFVFVHEIASFGLKIIFSCLVLKIQYAVYSCVIRADCFDCIDLALLVLLAS